MVRCKRPFYASTATGKLGDPIQFAQTARGTVAGKRRRPKQPRTLAQRATRIYMRFLAGEWANLPAAQQASWDAHPIADHTSRYHAYLSHNANAYKNLAGALDAQQNADWYPTAIYPPPKDTLGHFWLYHGYTAASGEITVDMGDWNHRDGWLLFFHIATAAEPLPVYGNLVYLTADAAPGHNFYRIQNLPAGSHTFYWNRNAHSGYSYYLWQSFSATVPP
jgi:hypothetical protein